MSGLIIALSLFSADAQAGATPLELHQFAVELERSKEALQDDVEDAESITTLTSRWSRARNNRNKDLQSATDADIRQWLRDEIAEGELEVMEARREVAQSRQELQSERDDLRHDNSARSHREVRKDQQDLEDDLADLDLAERDLSRTSALLSELKTLDASFGWRISRSEQAAKEALLQKIVRLAEREVERSVTERNEDRDARAEMYTDG